MWNSGSGEENSLDVFSQVAIITTCHLEKRKEGDAGGKDGPGYRARAQKRKVIVTNIWRRPGRGNEQCHNNNNNNATNQQLIITVTVQKHPQPQGGEETGWQRWASAREGRVTGQPGPKAAGSEQWACVMGALRRCGCQLAHVGARSAAAATEARRRAVLVGCAAPSRAGSAAAWLAGRESPRQSV